MVSSQLARFLFEVSATEDSICRFRARRPTTRSIGSPLNLYPAINRFALEPCHPRSIIVTVQRDSLFALNTGRATVHSELNQNPTSTWWEIRKWNCTLQSCSSLARFVRSQYRFDAAVSSVRYKQQP